MAEPDAAGTRLETFCFLLVPGLSMMSLMSAVEPLRSLNRLIGRDAFAWVMASPDGHPVTASNGLAVPTVPAAELPAADAVFVCGGLRIVLPDEKRYLAILRRFARQGLRVGSLSTGTYLLARAGLLDGHRCTIHWESRSAFQEDFPELLCSNKIYEIDRDRLTCSGGTAAMDLMLRLIADRYGPALARRVANQFHHERIRDATDDQRGGWAQSRALLPARLQEAVALMERTIEEPLSLPEVARRVGVSVRQLERTFLAHLAMTPLRFYLQLRVERTRELLLYSDRSVTEIAVAAGFTSVSHFSAWYRRIYGTTPSAMRGRPGAPPPTT